MKTRVIPALFLLVGLASAAAHADGPYSFTYTANPMAEPHHYGTTVKLLDGRVLVTGGLRSSGSAELFDPTTNTFGATGSPVGGPRIYVEGVRLQDGTVLIPGGFNYSAGVMRSADLYNPTTGTFSLTEGPMATERARPTVTLLEDGTVLVTGGVDSSGAVLGTAELYDPTTRTFSPTGSMLSPRSWHSAVRLGNGKVLVTGGQNGPGPDALAAAEIYDPATRQFTATTPMGAPRYGHISVTLLDGRVLVAGGYDIVNNNVYANVQLGGEMFDPATGSFASVGFSPAPEGFNELSAVLLGDGAVLLVGGYNMVSGPTSAAYLFRGSEFMPIVSMNDARVKPGAVLLDDGRVLIAAGQTFASTAELFAAVGLSTTGSISVSASLPGAAFIITGPANYSGSGMSFVVNDAPAGTYTIAYGAVAGYVAPPSGTQTLAGGGSIAFAGTYSPSTGSLLLPIHKTQLATWLGQGSLSFTNVYTKTVGDTSADFHAAVDGKGATFTVLEAVFAGTTYLIGGYNPQSWSSIDEYHITLPDSERTAFIYNLSTGLIQRQKLSTDPYSSALPYSGIFQTYNNPLTGPQFGVDVFVSGNLAAGHVSQYAYGSGAPCGYGGISIVGVATINEPCPPDTGGYPGLSIAVGALEVYSFDSVWSTLDADNDGVPDALDRCPNTVAGAVVDASGCSARQRDSDRDGFSDAEETAAGSDPSDAASVPPPTTVPPAPSNLSGQWAMVNILADYNIVLHWQQEPSSAKQVQRYNIYVRHFDWDVDVTCGVRLLNYCVLPKLTLGDSEWKAIASVDAPRQAAVLDNILSLLPALVRPGEPLQLVFAVTAVNAVGEGSASDSMAFLPTGRQLETNSPTEPVVFVPGWNGDLATWQDAVARLTGLFGWKSCEATIGGNSNCNSESKLFKVAFTDPFRGIRPLATDLAGYLSQFGQDVTLVGHSAGGVVSRACVQDDAGCRSKVRRVVTYGSPHNGVGWANLADGVATVSTMVSSLRQDQAAITSFCDAMAKDLPWYGRLAVSPSAVRSTCDAVLGGLNAAASYAGTLAAALNNDQLRQDLRVGSSVLSELNAEELPPTVDFVWLVGDASRLAAVLGVVVPDSLDTLKTAMDFLLKGRDGFVSATSQVPESATRGGVGTTINRDPFIHALAGEYFSEGADYVGVLKGLGYRVLSVQPGSPISLTIVDPDGKVMSPNLNSIPGATYTATGGIEIPNPKSGGYTVIVAPHPQTGPEARYSLTVELDGQVSVLADQRPISEIPPEGYSVAVQAPPGNQPPFPRIVVSPLVEATSAAGATVTLDGTASTDPDGDALSYAWTGPFGVMSGALVKPLLPLGSHVAMLTVDDGHGSRSTTGVVVTVRDTTPPTVHCGSSDGQWHAANVVITCSATDSGTGLASSGDATFTLATAVPDGTETANASTGSRSVCDVTGNCTTVGAFTGIKVDRKAPVITISNPIIGTVVLNKSVLASYSCADAGSGVASCAGTSANGAAIDTATPGLTTFTVSARDPAGNETASSVAYSVIYNIGALYDQGKAKNSGSTVPIKIQLLDAAGTNVSAAGVSVTAIGVSLVSAVAPGPLEDSGKANPDGNFRFARDSYIFNLKTTGLGTGTYILYFRCGADPTLHTVRFQLK
jgi:pimeloyl-ACP methyl ester carboxylesterase